MARPGEPLRIFCSFAPEDEALYLQLHNHLRLLEREGILTLWHQHLLTAGMDWAKVIDEELTRASIILLLISPAFFASDYYSGIEMQQAMQKHNSRKAHVVPVLLRPVDWTLAPFAHLSFLPSNNKFVVEWSNQDAAFTDIVKGLRRVIEELASGSDSNVHRRATYGVWNVPYRRNPHFTGRDELLEKLDRQLSSKSKENPTATCRAALTQPQAIKGLGGVGKTQIAVEYAYRTQEQGCYTHILWVNAASEEAMMTSFLTLAELLPAFPAQKETDQRKLIAAIKRWLEHCPQSWLLIFDNANAVSLVQEYLPTTGNGGILLTTRSSAVGSLASSIEVENMSFVEGTHLLLHRAQRLAHASDEEINDAGNIVVALDHFPLALDQAGAYIEETRCSFADYLNLFHNHRKEILAKRGEQTTNYPDSVMTTWSLSFQKVEQANPAASELLRLCAFLAPDRIPEELFREGMAYWTIPLQQAVTNLFTFNQMLQDLLKFSLVKRLAEDHLLSIHRLVQAVQIDKMELEEQRQWAARVIRAVNTAFPLDPKNETTTWPQCLRYLEQAQACHVLIQQHRFLFPEAADVLDRAAIYLREHASYTIAESLCQLSLQIREQHVASPLNNLATLYREQGKYAEAEPLYQRAIHTLEQSVGPEHPQVADALNGLAILYFEQGKYAEAEPLYLRAIHILEQSVGLEHPQAAFPLNGLAVIYYEQGKYAEAEPLYLQVLQIWEQSVTGSEHPHMARTVNNLATLYGQQGRYAEAEPLYLRALHIWEQSVGSEHPQVAALLGSLATLYCQQGRYVEAEPLYLQAIQVLEQGIGPEYFQVSYPLINLATIYREQGKYAKAESLYLRAIRVLEQGVGSEHPHMAAVLINQAELKQMQDKYEEAELLYWRALRIWEQNLGSDHPYTAHTLNGLADLYRIQGKYDEAVSFYEQALFLREHALEPHHPDLADTLYGLAALHEVLGNLEKAAPLYQRALTIREQALGSQHPEIINSHCN